MTHILIVEDEIELGRFLARLLELKGFQTTQVTSGHAFDQLDDLSPFAMAFIDVRLPDRNGIDILRALQTKAPRCPCVIMTGYSTVKIAVDAIRYGAADFIEKPFEDIDMIDQLTDRLVGTRQSTLDEEADYERIARDIGCFLGTSRAMHQLYALAYKVAPKKITTLIQGETGTGKEVLATFLHAASGQNGPIITINCGALPESLLESELFGHVKGAFTGASTDRAGYFEAASSGTLFLDEIAEASLSTQVKLLRVLETGEFMKIGGTTTQRTSARIIAASHVKLEEAVQRGEFREDLYYRLDVVKLVIPPLRERREDIPLLVHSLLAQHEEKITFSPASIDMMTHYDWPGNMRELANSIRQIAALSNDGAVITPLQLPAKITGQSKQSLPTAPSTEPIHFPDEWQQFSDTVMGAYKGQDERPLDEVIEVMKKMEKRTATALIQKALQETAGNRKAAAEKLGISLRKIRYYLNET
ncbi:sigma-54 dependent transcriptional regulator [Sporosarcina sp. FSL K6-1522]|uniref:sigma-54-dependent transcriptional regulator n=1 Tax=Sporosarcina sp. FSL K6-1522 TaxID=2921554 RepID=UPI00315A68D8